MNDVDQINLDVTTSPGWRTELYAFIAKAKRRQPIRLPNDLAAITALGEPMPPEQVAGFLASLNRIEH